jgi:putative ABC transport system permease protein
MRIIRSIRLRIRSLFRRNRIEKELNAEMRDHLERQIQLHVSAGMSPRDARNVALREFGNVALIQEQCRDERHVNYIEDIFRDIFYALRSMRHSLGFALVAMLILALGIGANSAIFSLVSAVLLRPLPFPESDRVVLLHGSPSGQLSTPADYVGWKERSRSFVEMAALMPDTYNLTGTGEPEKLEGIRTTANLFAILGMQPLLGRTLAPSDEGSDAGPVVVISERLWRYRFGADPGVAGRTIRLNGLTHTVIGVVPADFQFPSKNAVLWLPARFTSEELAQRTSYTFYVLARLKSDIALSQAQAEMATIAHQLRREYRWNEGGRVTVTQLVTVTPLHEILTRDSKPAISILLGAVALVLLIASANLANLLLARCSIRRKELAVRQALGAGRGRLMRQLLTESAVLSVFGMVGGLAFASVTFGYLERLVPNGLPQGVSPHLDVRVILFSIVVTALMVLGLGTGPVLAAARLDLDAALKAGTNRGTTASVGRRVRNGLVVAEVTLTVVLLVAAGLLLRSYAKVLAVDPGFDPHQLLIAETVLPPSKYGTLESRSAFYRRVLERVQTLPGVSTAAYTSYPPLTFKGGRVFYLIEGRTMRSEEFDRYIASDRVVSPGYFSTLGVPLRHGRYFDERDGAGAPLAIIINEKLAAMHWPGEDPVGRRIKFPAGVFDRTLPGFTIVGVVGDMRQMGLDTPAEPEMYFSMDQMVVNSPLLWPQHLVVRTKGDPLALSASVRRAVWDVDPDQPVSSIRSMDEIFDAELLNRNTQMTLFSAFAALALVLASVGLYGVLSYTVAQRTSEIGLRMALGAQRATVVGEVVRKGLLLVALGFMLGLAGAFALTRLLTSFLFGIQPTDPATVAAVSALLLFVAILASYIPARRAAGVDPVSALRAE